jgi:hypothetical protein
VAGLLVLGGLAGYGAAGASLGDGAGLVGLALGDVSPGGLALAEIGAGEAG